MFRADAEADDARGDAPKVWNFCQQAHRERRLERSGLTSTRAMIRRCTVTCNHCVTRVGNSRRCWTRRR